MQIRSSEPVLLSGLWACAVENGTGFYLELREGQQFA